MALVIVGISEMAISDNSDEVLVTYSLGSCIGLTLYDPALQVGAMLHSMLPLSRLDQKKALSMPCMFTDSGVTRLLQAMFNKGAKRERLVAKVAGASSLLDKKRLFKIGERNYTVLRKILWKNNILIASEDVGGTCSRTMRLYIATGETTISSGDGEVTL